MSFYKGKLALVTGASEGIGRSVAEQLASQGGNVVMLARRPDVLEAAAQQIQSRASNGSKIVPLSCDVSDWEATRAKVTEAMDQHGVPDLVINCAGLAYPGWLDASEIEHGTEMMRTNYFGTMHICTAVLPRMRERRSGHIVNTSSLGGLFGLFGYTAYCASKFAVVGFSEALRREVAVYGIKVTMLCPPNVQTPGLERENKFKPPEVLAQEEKATPVSPDFVAGKLLADVAAGRRVCIPGMEGKLAWMLSRWAPGVLDMILARPKPK